MYMLYENQECFDLIQRELEKNSNLLRSINLTEYFLKIDKKCQWIKWYINEELVGVIAYYCNDLVSKIAYITLVLVDAEYRGRGIAKMMLEKLFLDVKLKDFNQCHLEVNSQNFNAYNLYRNLGFRILKEKSIDSYIMCKDVV